MNPLPVVFVHGLRVTGAMWLPQLDSIGRYRRVAAPDLPGHGSRHREPFTLDSATAAIGQAIDELGGRVMLVGLSLGGYVAIATAARYPDKTAGLVAIGCTSTPSPLRMLPYRLLARMGDGIQRWLFRRMLGAEGERIITGGGLFTSVVPPALDAIGSFDPIAALSRYPGRTWLINGSRDHFRSDENRFLASCRDGRLDHVAGAGHLVSITHPQSISDRVQVAAGEAERLVGRPG